MKEQEDDASEEDQDKPESEASGKTSSSDSGIEDGKITPTSEEEPKGPESCEPSPVRTEEPSGSECSSETTERPPVTLMKPDERSLDVTNPTRPPEPTRHASAASDRSSSVGDDVDALILDLSGDMSVSKDAGSLSVRVRLCVQFIIVLEESF